MEDQNIKNAFYHLNSFKRHRSLLNIERSKPAPDVREIHYHELKMYQFIDNLELSIRAINKDNREGSE